MAKNKQWRRARPPGGDSQLTVLLDASNSMEYNSGGPKNMDSARLIAASLFYLVWNIRHRRINSMP